MLLRYYSSWDRVESGVPQRSVLGPLFFLVFINNKEEIVFNRVLAFADDTKVVWSCSC